MWQTVQKFREAQMQDKVREATKYVITIEREDYEPVSDTHDKIKVSFRSDKYCTREYIQNLKAALFTILDHETHKQQKEESDE